MSARRSSIGVWIGGSPDAAGRNSVRPDTGFVDPKLLVPRESMISDEGRAESVEASRRATGESCWFRSG